MVGVPCMSQHVSMHVGLGRSGLGVDRQNGRKAGVDLVEKEFGRWRAVLTHRPQNFGNARPSPLGQVRFLRCNSFPTWPILRPDRFTRATASAPNSGVNDRRFLRDMPCSYPFLGDMVRRSTKIGVESLFPMPSAIGSTSSATEGRALGDQRHAPRGGTPGPAPAAPPPLGTKPP